MTDLLNRADNRADYEELPPLEKPDGHTRLKHKDGRILTLSPGVTWEDHVAKQTAPPPLPDPDPRDVEIANLKASLVLVNARLDKLDGGDRELIRRT